MKSARKAQSGWWIAGTSAALLGCMTNAPAPEAHEAALVGGAPESGHRAVGCLQTTISVSAEEMIISRCTATLVTDRVLLTAAHCIQPDTVPADVQFFTGSDCTQLAAVATDLSYEGSLELAALAPSTDFLLVTLDRPVNEEPVQLRTAPLEEGDIGTDAEMVGFGLTDGNDLESSGTKRSAPATLTDVGGGSLSVDVVGGDPCFGDSGGPLFIDGQLAGILSQAIEPCVGPAAAYTPISRFLELIEEHTGLSLVEDAPTTCAVGYCVAGDGNCDDGLGCCSFDADCGTDTECSIEQGNCPELGETPDTHEGAEGIGEDPLSCTCEAACVEAGNCCSTCETREMAPLGCSATGTSSGAQGWWFFLVLAGALAYRRRRSGRGALTHWSMILTALCSASACMPQLRAVPPDPAADVDGDPSNDDSGLDEQNHSTDQDTDDGVNDDDPYTPVPTVTPWMTTLELPGDDMRSHGMSILADGVLLSGNNTDVLVSKLNPDGRLAWSKSLDTGEDDYAADVLGMEDGGFMATGAGYAGDMWLARIGPQGDVLWANSYGHYATSSISQLVDDGAGGAFVIAGTFEDVFDDSAPGGAWVLHIDRSGNTVSETLIEGVGQADLRTALPTRDGGLVLGGDHSLEWFGDLLLLKLDANGNIVWQIEMGEVDEPEYASQISEAPNGDIVVLGGTSSYSQHLSGQDVDLWFLRFDSNGSLLDQTVIGDRGLEVGDGMVPLDDGGYMLVGESWGSGDFLDLFLVGVDDEGTVRWEKRVGGDEWETPTSVERFGDGVAIFMDSRSLTGTIAWHTLMVGQDGSIDAPCFTSTPSQSHVSTSTATPRNPGLAASAIHTVASSVTLTVRDAPMTPVLECN